MIRERRQIRGCATDQVTTKTMGDSPLVSILINNYNYETFLVDAIESALAQSYQNIEVIVVDDGSTDASAEVIKGYGDRIIPVLKQNGGQGSAFNAGLLASHGDIICLLDADDYFIANKVEKVVAAWAKDPNAGWLFHTLQDVDQQGQHLKDGAPLSAGSFDFRSAMQAGGKLPILPATSGLCFRRDVLSQALPMPERLHDEYLRLATIFLAPGILCPDSLAVHRIHGGNMFEGRAEGQNNTAAIRSKNNIRAAYHLHQRFPQARAYANRLFAHAFGQLLAYWGIGRTLQIAEAKQYIQSYWTVDVWIASVTRTLYNYGKAIKFSWSKSASPT